MGGHVIKTGLGPLIVDLIRRGFVSGIVMNGAALIHDFEIALSGQTSEDVEAGLSEGKFGMATETGLFLNQIAGTAAFSGIGYGEAAGKFLSGRQLQAQNARASVLFNAYRLRIPVTIHLAIGAERNASWWRISELGLGSTLARDFFEGGVGGEKSRRAPGADYHRQLRFYPALPAAAECSKASDSVIE